MIGPQADPDPALYACSRVVQLGPVRLERLPHVARAAAALVIPYADLPVTRVMQPLKLKEYLATGKPVIARALPATDLWADCLDLVDSSEQFSQRVRLRLDTGLPEQQRIARKRLMDESWSQKAQQFASWTLAEERSERVTERQPVSGECVAE